MSVYKEGFHAIKEIEAASKRIFEDAADFGAPCNKGDKIWNAAKQLVDWYGVPGSRTDYSKGVTQTVELMDEWAVSDRRKTEEEATEYYRVSYHKANTGACKGYDGFISVEKIS